MFVVFCARCSACDTLFNSLMDLEHHKEALGHWSDEDEDEDEDEDDESDIEYDYYFGKLSTLYYSSIYV